jgi:3-deoxy-D-manno-octulosonate 8-phosphate phosphatase (KDO 8-P phosphatase)
MDIQNYKAQLGKTETFIFDVDGVFTDNIVYLTADGQQMRTANVRDGYAVQLAVKKGIKIFILSGGNNEAVRKRFEMLGVKEIHLGVPTKKEVLQKWIDEGKIDPSTTTYMGDDIPDFWVMQMVAMACCPQDAAFEIRKISDYISPFKGGQGCVRDVLEQSLKLKNMWLDDESTSW